MKSEGDVASARTAFLNNRFQNLDFLLQSRYSWMNEFISDYQKEKPFKPLIIEIGCGSGFSPLYIDAEIVLTDVVKNEWVDKIIDATNMNLEDESVDIIFTSNTIHHFYSPVKFFNETIRVLKPNGLILINESNLSVLMRTILKLMRHEGWNYDIDVFDINAVVNDPNDPWSGNNAISQLLFDKNRQKFENNFKSLNVIVDKPCECFVFPLSGGVTAKTKVPRLPYRLLKAFNKLDCILVGIAPQIFALSRRIVLKKLPNN
jgi:SAM-dependent methyltransferase